MKNLLLVFPETGACDFMQTTTCESICHKITKLSKLSTQELTHHLWRMLGKKGSLLEYSLKTQTIKQPHWANTG